MSVPDWFTYLSWAALAAGLASALGVIAGELRAHDRRRLGVMDIVHPVTALYLGPVWPLFLRRARRGRGVALAVSHCGAGCTLGDICGEWLLFAAFGSPVLGLAGVYGWEVVADFCFAWTLGIAFQYATIAPEEGGRPLARLRRAIEVDTLSILAFQVGLFGWMALARFVVFQPPLPVDSAGHWFSMQIGMIAGFATAWPVNAWLVRVGIKPAHHG